MQRKVFCIGFHKTGTTSLAVALRTLGYRVTGPNGVLDPDIATHVYSMANSLVRDYDAFQDNPWPIIYREMDKKYPNSKFILTVRNSNSWIQSQVKHFGRLETPMRKWIYGVGFPKGNEEIYIQRYENHNLEVMNYFKDRPDDLLVLELAEENHWEKLCSFLGVEIPKEPFPHVNKASDREIADLPRQGLIKRIGRFQMKYRCEIPIELPRDRVIALFDDPDNLPKWQPGLYSFEHLSGEVGQPGARSRLLFDQNRRRIEMIETITVRNLPDEFSGMYETKGVKNWVVNRFYEVGPRRTRWVSENEFRFCGLMAIMGFFMRGTFPKQTQEFMSYFKEFAESV